MPADMKRNTARIRAALLRLLRKKGGGHLGGSMSIVEALSVIYTEHLRFDPANPKDPKRDYMVLSKGHAGPALYAALSVFGFFPEADTYSMNDGGTRFPSHPDCLKTPGVDVTTGSLGQGISVAAGLGMAFKMEKSDQRVYVILGDGELNEGQCWEAFQFIAHYRLNNVIVLIDANKRQLDGYTRDVMNPFDLSEKMSAFGFKTFKADGRNEESISAALNSAKEISNSAVCIVLDTVKGQGVKYFEDLADNHSVKLREQDVTVMDEAISRLEAQCKEEA